MENKRNFEILMNIAEDFKSLPNVEAIVLGGSSSAKTEDVNSDFDIYIYSDSEIDVSKRRQIAEKYSNNPEINNTYWETGDEWTLKETGKQIDIMYRSKDWIENQIKNVWQNHQASLGYTTCFVDNVNKSQILYDKNAWFKNLQEQTHIPYPETLADNIIKKNLPLLKDKPASSYFQQIEKAVKRDDFVSVNHRITAFLASYFDIIFAINKILHPGEKRLVQFAIKNCSILPKNFEQNINLLILSEPEHKVDILNDMVMELKAVL